MDTIIFWLKAMTHGVEHVLIVGRFRLQWQQCLRETAWTTAQLTDLLFQFNPTPRDLIASQRMAKKLTSMTMRMKPAEICQMPATMQTGETVRQAETPKTIATEDWYFENQDEEEEKKLLPRPAATHTAFIPIFSHQGTWVILMLSNISCKL